MVNMPVPPEPPVPGQAAAPQSLVDVFEATVARRGDHLAGLQKRGGRWVSTTWAELGRRARDVSDGLAALGVSRGDRLSVVGEVSLEWILADLGVMGAAAVTVPIYQSNLPEQCRFILEDAGVSWIFCDSDEQIAKIRAVRERLPRLRGVIRFHGAPADAFERTLAEVEAAGVAWRAARPGAHAARLASLSRADAASIIYTSGTTGDPKGVVLTHGNWIYEAEAAAAIGVMGEDDLALAFLPLAHSFAKANQAVWLAVGGAAACVEALDKIVENAAEVHPTVMPSVPRVFEKVHAAVLARGLALPGVKGAFFRLAMEGLDRFADARDRGEAGGGGWRLALGKALVFPKIGAQLRRAFGGRMRLFISGGAPLSTRVAWFFRLAGFEICEGYGLTETAAATFVNRPGRVRIGTVGEPMPGTEVRIAPDGEILVKGPGVMKGYHGNPAATAEVLVDGWLHTGDVGDLDADGYLRITDRKKDLIVTAGGKNVAPQVIENDLKADPLVSNVMVHGDRRKFLSALVTLDPDGVRAWAAEAGVTLSAPLHEDPRVRARVQEAIDAVNARQPRYATVKRFAVLPGDFSEAGGELTPTLKVRRRRCEEKHRALLDALYRE